MVGIYQYGICFLGENENCDREEEGGIRFYRVGLKLQTLEINNNFYLFLLVNNSR